MADKDFFLDADFGQLVTDLLAEFGVEGKLVRTNNGGTDPADPRRTVAADPDEYTIDVLAADAVRGLLPDKQVANSDSIFFSGKGLSIVPDPAFDFLKLKKPGETAFNDIVKVTKYKPVLRGLENVIMWEAEVAS